jgi:hypothetical protein
MREALGQIIEYVHFRDCPINASKMFVIGMYPPNEEESRYVKNSGKNTVSLFTINNMILNIIILVQKCSSDINLI